MQDMVSHGEEVALVVEQLPFLDMDNWSDELLGGKAPVFFFDYDGTLTPITDNPSEALLSEEMRKVLHALSSRFTCAIVSGRDRMDVKELVGLDEMYYAGSHGYDISGPDGLQFIHEAGENAFDALNRAEEIFQEKLKQEGVLIDRKRFALAIHYRHVTDAQVAEVKKVVDEVLVEFSALKPGLGKKVIELKPSFNWHKGKAVLWLMERIGLSLDAYLPVFIGDDITDEDGFKAVKELGIGIIVGDHGEPTYATYRLKDCNNVKILLERMLEA